VKLPVIQPEGGAFALALRNLDPLPDEARERWASAIVHGAARSSSALPERLIVELLNSCNLDCPMCRVGEFGVDLDRRMPFELFCRLADQLFDHVREVRLNGLGETTLLPDLDRYLDVLEQHDVPIELITNGTGTLAIYERLVASGGTWSSPARRVTRSLRWCARLGRSRASGHR
jgi:hypothetical protein